MLEIRDFEPFDYEQLARLRSAWLHGNQSAEAIREEDLRVSTVREIRRWVATGPTGVVGYASATREFNNASDGWYMSVALDPLGRGKGLGRQLFEMARGYARSNGAGVLLSYIREGEADAIGFAERMGFEFVEKYFDSALDLESVDAAALRLRYPFPSGFGVRRFTEVLAEENFVKRLHRLHAEIQAAMPGATQGVRRPLAEFESMVLHAPGFRPEHVRIATQGTDWIGLSILFREGREGRHESTGILPHY